MDPGTEHRDDALLTLLRLTRSAAYSFTTVTPLTNARVNARLENARAKDLAGVFGWSIPFGRGFWRQNYSKLCKARRNSKPLGMLGVPAFEFQPSHQSISSTALIQRLSLTRCFSGRTPCASCARWNKISASRGRRSAALWILPAARAPAPSRSLATPQRRRCSSMVIRRADPMNTPLKLLGIPGSLRRSSYTGLCRMNSMPSPN